MARGGFTAQEAGLLWLEIGLVSVVSGFIWGGISDRWGRRVALVGVFALQGASFLVFGATRALAAVYLSAGLFAVTAWSVPALMAASAGDMFGARLAPAAIGLMTIVLSLGQALGPYLAGRIADAARSFAPAFLTAGCVALVLGAGGSFLLRPRYGQSTTGPDRGPTFDRCRLADHRPLSLAPWRASCVPGGGGACIVDGKEGTP